LALGPPRRHDELPKKVRYPRRHNGRRDSLAAGGRGVLAYVPRERYEVRDDVRGHSDLNPERREEWSLCKDFGAIFDLKLNSTRPATSAEYKGRKGLKIFPDDIIGKANIRHSRGNKSIYPDIKRGTKIHCWTVGRKVHIPKRKQYRYECTCACAARTVQYLSASDLLLGKRHGCLKCGHTRRPKWTGAINS